MNQDVVAGFFKLLSGLTPGWILLILVAVTLSWKAHLIIREFFAGIRGLKSVKRSPAEKSIAKGRDSRAPVKEEQKLLSHLGPQT